MFAAKTCWFVWFRGKICLPCPCVRFKADLLKPDRLELNSGFIRFHPKFTQKGPLVAIPGTTSSFIDGQRLFLYNHNASQLDHRCFPISFTKLTAGWYLGCLFATWTHPLTSGYLGRCTRLNQRRSITCSCSFCQLPGESRTQWAIFLFGFQSYVSLTGGTKISKIAREDHDFHPVSWIMCFFPQKKNGSSSRNQKTHPSHPTSPGEVPSHHVPLLSDLGVATWTSGRAALRLSARDSPAPLQKKWRLDPLDLKSHGLHHPQVLFTLVCDGAFSHVR